jgi:hypothetical protein
MIKVVVHHKKLWLRGTIGKVRCVAGELSFL